MDKRKIAVVLIIPLAMLMVVPFSTHASTVYYSLFVSCNSYEATKTADTASLWFLGHGVSVFCRYDSEFHSNGVVFSSSMSGTYRALMDAGSNIQSDQGTFGPNVCGTYVDGAVYDSNFYTWSFFEISIACA